MDSDPADGRIKFYSLSESGVQMVSEANVKMKEMNASLFQNLVDNSAFLEELKGVYQTLNERFKT
jgi:DNA-binding MarR family transcriptional regulator